MKKNFTEGRISYNIFSYTISLIICNLIQQIYHTADMIIVGGAIGTEAFSAIGAVSPLIYFVNGIFSFISIGVSIKLSQAIGGDDTKKICLIGYASIVLTIFLGIILAIIAPNIVKIGMHFLQLDHEIWDYAEEYLNVIFRGAVLSLIYNTLFSILRAMGISIIPICITVVSSFLNIFLDYYFIYNLNMGITGAALSTLIAYFLVDIICFGFIIRYYHKEKILSRKNLHLDWIIIREISACGLPICLQNLVISFTNVFIVSNINKFGGIYTTAYSVFARLDAFIILPMTALGTAYSVFVGQNYGKRLFGRINNARKIITEWVSVYVLMVLLVTRLIVVPYIEKYFDENTFDILNSMLVILPLYWFMGIYQIYLGEYKGIGNTLMASKIAILNFAGLRLLWLLFIAIPRNSLVLIILSYAVGWIGGCTVFRIKHKAIENY